MTTRLPNFFLIGAPKAGTNALHQYFDRHHEIFVCHPKEPHFLHNLPPQEIGRGPGDDERGRRVVITWKSYEKLFQAATTEKAIGDASTSYLYSPGAFAAITKYFPSARIIAVLRQPAERAYSNYCHARRDGWELETDFLKAIKDQDRRLAAGWGRFWAYKQNGFYAESVRRYKTFFGDRMLVILYEDWKSYPDATLRRIFQHLGVDDRIQFSHLRYNTSGIPYSRTLHRALSGKIILAQPLKPFIPKTTRSRLRAWFRAINMKACPPLEAEVKAEITSWYREDILELQELIHKDLSSWLKT